VIGERRSADDDRVARMAAVVVCLLAAVAVGGGAVRDGLFLTVLRAEHLPQVMLASAVLCLASAGLAVRLVARHGLGHVLSLIAAAGGGAFAVECLLLGAYPRAATWAVYLHVALLGSIPAVSLSAVLDGFGVGDGRRRRLLATAGVVLGSSVGALLVERATAWLGPRVALLVMAILCAALAAITQRLPGPGVSLAGAGWGVSELRRSRCLPALALLGALVGFSSLCADYVLKLEASRGLRSIHSLVAFFSLFYVATVVVGFSMNAWLPRPALQRFGLGAVLASLPALALLAGVFALGLTRLWTTALLKGTHTVLDVSLFRPARDRVAAPFGSDGNAQGSWALGPGAVHAGEVAAGAVLLGLVALVPRVPTAAVVGVVVLCAAFGLWASYRVTQRYAAELRAGLHAGSVRIESPEIADATTRGLLAEHTSSAEKEQLLAELKRLRRSRVGVIERPSTPSQPPPEIRRPGDSALLDALAELTAGEPSRVVAALKSGSLDTRALAQVIALLANDRTWDAAAEALRRRASSAAGVLSDALLDPRQPFAVRRRVPRLLGEVKSSRVVAALLEALNDEELEVRRRSGRALHQIVLERPELRPEPWVVHQAAMREIELLPQPEAQTAADPALQRRARAQLRHVLTLAGLGGEPEAFELVARALESGNERARATAVQYLDSVLPAHLRKLMAHVGEVAVDGGASRSRQELLDELSRLGAPPNEVDESLPPPAPG
jgi:HEAT repeat protein